MAQDIPSEVKRIIKEQLDVDEKDIKPESSFIDDLGADSLGLVELVLAFEEAFEIDIPDEHTEKIRTVQDAIELHREAREEVRPVLSLVRCLSGSQPSPPALSRQGRARGSNTGGTFSPLALASRERGAGAGAGFWGEGPRPLVTNRIRKVRSAPCVAHVISGT